MTAPERRLVYLINVGQRRLQRWIQTRTGEGVTAAQSGLLFFLEKNDGALMREAGAALDLGPSAMSGLVDRTADAGLIERRADAKDGRAWQLWPPRVSANAARPAGVSRPNRRRSLRLAIAMWRASASSPDSR